MRRARYEAFQLQPVDIARGERRTFSGVDLHVVELDVLRALAANRMGPPTSCGSPERLGSFTQDRKVGVVDKEAAPLPAGDLA